MSKKLPKKLGLPMKSFSCDDDLYFIYLSTFCPPLQLDFPRVIFLKLLAPKHVLECTINISVEHACTFQNVLHFVSLAKSAMLMLLVL